MNNIYTVLGSLLLLAIAAFLFTLGWIALRSPQKIIDYYISVFRKMPYLKKMQAFSVKMAQQSWYYNNLRSSSIGLFLMGLIFLYAAISALLSLF